jgi:hypothetical protein
VDNFADVSDVNAASFFRIEVCGMLNFCVYEYIAFCFKSKEGTGLERVGIRAFFEPIRKMDQEVLQTVVLIAREMYLKIS